MSSQKGNNARTRPQKYQNRRVFKNNLHDTSHRTKLLNTIQVSDVCARCKEIIEWKIKYKKYKPLTQMKRCVKCDEKKVKQAYHVMCPECGRSLGVCTKCCAAKEVVEAAASEQEQQKLDSEMKAVLVTLSERKRRTFLRYMERMNKEEEETKRNDLMKMINELKGDQDEDEDEDFDFD